MTARLYHLGLRQSKKLLRERPVLFQEMKMVEIEWMEGCRYHVYNVVFRVEKVSHINHQKRDLTLTVSGGDVK